MSNKRKWAMIVALVLLIVAALAACQAEPEVVEVEVTRVVTETVELEGESVEVTRVVTEVEEVEVTRVVEAEEGEEDMAEGGELAEVYRIGMFEEPVSLNYWNYLGPGSSVWTQYVLSGYAPTLFTLSDQRYDFVPQLATELPEPTDLGEGNWEMVVNMVQDAQWSDGEAITADDVVFTHNACLDLQLTQNWPNACAPTGAEVTAEAADEYTVRYTFNTTPSLGVWNAGIALAPILPEHFWGDTVAEARGFIEGLEEPTPPEDVEDCQAEELSAEDAEACEPYLADLEAYNEAFTNARTTLYEADATGSPTYGGMITDQWEPGAFVQRTANDNYYLAGARIVEYDDGTWVLENPNGQSYQLFGDAAGEVTLDYVSGPYAQNVLLSLYGSQDAAFLALANGEVDYVLNPLGLSRGLREQAERGEGVTAYNNADYGLFYLAFNMRKDPMGDQAFRSAVNCVIDKEFVTSSVLQGSVFPMYSTMPPGNGFWHNPDVPRFCDGMTREERVNEAIAILTEAGYSWETQPAWSEDLQDVEPGVGLTGPDGQPLPELTILGPGPSYDPIRATFNQWISEWMRELGIPVESELTGFNTILDPVFVDANFDMYILGWSLGNEAFPDYYESFWHSRNDTATSGNFNTPGYNNPEYDALIDEFMSTTELDRAQEIIYEAQIMLAEDLPYIPLFYQQVTDLARDNIVFPYTEILGGFTEAAGFQTDAQPLTR